MRINNQKMPSACQVIGTAVFQSSQACFAELSPEVLLNSPARRIPMSFLFPLVYFSDTRNPSFWSRTDQKIPIKAWKNLGNSQILFELIVSFSDAIPAQFSSISMSDLDAWSPRVLQFGKMIAVSAPGISAFSVTPSMPPSSFQNIFLDMSNASFISGTPGGAPRGELFFQKICRFLPCQECPIQPVFPSLFLRISILKWSLRPPWSILPLGKLYFPFQMRLVQISRQFSTSPQPRIMFLTRLAALISLNSLTAPSRRDVYIQRSHFTHMFPPRPVYAPILSISSPNVPNVRPRPPRSNAMLGKIPFLPQQLAE